MSWFAVYGVALIVVMVSVCSIIIFRPTTDTLARKVAALLKDGRPEGCTCRPNPGMNALPSDNRHMSDKDCPVTIALAVARAAGQATAFRRDPQARR